MEPQVVGEVTLGHRNAFETGVVIYGPASIGDENFFGAYAAIGGISRQSYRLSRERGLGRVEIGSGNYFGERVVIHRPVGECTDVGDFNSIGAGTHIAHDSRIGSHVTVSVNCALGGYSVMLAWSGLGIGCVVHPRTVMGHWSFAGMAAAVTRNVGIGELVVGNPACFLRYNFEAFARSGLSARDVIHLREFLEDGIPPSSDFLHRAVSEYRSMEAGAVRNRVLRSWADLLSEVPYDPP